MQTLKDPNLVRSFQEFLGVRQILTEVEDDKLGSKHTKFPLSSSGSSDEEEPEDAQHSSSSTSVQESLKWLNSKTRVRRRVVTPPPLCDGSREDMESLEKETCEVLVVETNSFYDTFFRLATECGYEPFYITILPILFWNIDVVVARHAIMVWGLTMYIGQGAKQIFKIKRPASPPAIRLEDNPSLETEYGFPSTHATVATAFPFSLLFSFYARYVVRDIRYWSSKTTEHIVILSVCVFRSHCGLVSQ